MIEVPLGENAAYSGYTQDFHGEDDFEEMYIPECYRCIGVILYWKRKETYDHNLPIARYAVSAFHIRPHFHHGALKIVSGHFFDLIKELAKYRELLSLHYMGGRINTVQNKIFYKNSVKYFILPFKELFPHFDVQVYGPTAAQISSTFYVGEDLTVHVEREFFI